MSIGISKKIVVDSLRLPGESDPSRVLGVKAQNRKMTYPWLPYFLADFVAITLAYYLTLLLRFHSRAGQSFYDWVTFLLLEQPAGQTGASLEHFYYESAFRIILILTAVICFLYALHHLYAGRRFLLRQPEAWNVLVCNLMALAIFYVYWYLTRNTHHPRSLFASLIVLNIVLCLLLRALLVRVRRRWGIDHCAVLLVGDGPEAEMLQDLLDLVAPHGLYCRARVASLGSRPFADGLAEVRAALESRQFDMLVVADPVLTIAQIMQLLELTSELRLPVKILSAHLDVLVTEAHLPCDVLQGVPLVHFAVPFAGGRPGMWRRAFTILLALLLLVLCLPVLLLLALLIRWTSPGPAIFRQKRIGINRKPFFIYKFRTMRHLAEAELAEMESANESAGALFKIRKDPRITAVGRFLRRFSLDELPQLLNVIKGEMALVGPRPLPERDFAQYEEDWHYIRHGGMPGLTCLWQVSGRSHLNFHQMCILDVYYLRNHNCILDVIIALQTVRTVIFGIGAY